MEGINQLLNNRKENEMRFGSGENHMQGLYFDLLACLGGGDHPSLPPDFKLKPMTGFLDIVEAFNDVAKLHSAGSGIVCEVESNEFVQDEILTSSSGETLEATDQKVNSESQQSFPCHDNDSDDTHRQSSADDSNNTDSTHELGTAPSSSFTKSDDQIKTSPLEQLHTNAMNMQTNLDINGNGQCLNNFEIVAQNNAHNSSVVNPPDEQKIGAMEKEMLKYSEELKEIERMLKEHLVPPIGTHHPKPTSLVSGSESRTSELQSTFIANNNMVQTLADGLMSPSRALEMMYDMESNGSSRNPQSAHMSTYQSCTSFASWQNQPSANCFANPNIEPIRSTPSVYMECLNLDENGSSDYAQFTASLNSVVEASAKEDDQSVCEFRDCEDGNNLLAEMVNKFTTKVDTTLNDVSFHSVNEEESDVYEFADAEDSTKYKMMMKKKKIRFSDKSSAASSNDEHRWTSASGSDYEDVDDGSPHYKSQY